MEADQVIAQIVAVVERQVAGGAHWGSWGEEIARVFSSLLANPAERTKLGSRAKQLVTDNQGAADRTIKLLKPLLTS